MKGLPRLFPKNPRQRLVTTFQQKDRMGLVPGSGGRGKEGGRRRPSGRNSRCCTWEGPLLLGKCSQEKGTV